ncbi:MAG: Imm8 family immunity protein [Pirellula sp.]
MIEARVICLESNDHDDWADFEQKTVSDPYNDFGWFHITVGATNVDGGNDFQVCIATKPAIGRARRSGSVPGIIVDRFDAETIRKAVTDTVQCIQEDSWDRTIERLCEFMIWEYEGM